MWLEAVLTIDMVCEIVWHFRLAERYATHMKIIKRVCALVMACTSLFPVHSLSQTSSCVTPQTTPEQFACARKDFLKAEEEVKAVFAAAIRRYTPDIAEREENSRMPKTDRLEQTRFETMMLRDLRLSQQVWLRGRTTACKAVLDSYAFGTAGPAAELQCKAASTRNRASFLQGYFGQS